MNASTKIIAIANQKGGVGKTSSAWAIANVLQNRGKRLLLVDLDAQSNFSEALGIDIYGSRYPDVLDVITGKHTIDDAIMKTDQGDVLPASLRLAQFEAAVDGVAHEYRLREALQPVLDSYDHIIIDTPPGLGKATLNALTAATGVILPALADSYSVTAVLRAYMTIERIQRYLNPELKILGILMTSYASQTVMAAEISEALTEVADQIGTKLFDTKIRVAAGMSKMQRSGVSLYNYTPKRDANRIRADYESLISEIMGEQSNG